MTVSDKIEWIEVRKILLKPREKNVLNFQIKDNVIKNEFKENYDPVSSCLINIFFLGSFITVLIVTQYT